MAQPGGVRFSVWGFCLFIWQPRGVTPWPKMASWCTCCPMMGIYSTPPTVKFTRTWLNLSVTTWCHPHTIPILWKTSSQVQAAQKPISGNVCVVCIYVCMFMGVWEVDLFLIEDIGCIYTARFKRTKKQSSPTLRPGSVDWPMFTSGWAVSKPGWPCPAFHSTLTCISAGLHVVSTWL